MARREDVQSTYDRIASHFSSTRETPWPEVESFVNTYATGNVGLDIGCGNARHAKLLVDRIETVVGLDISRGLLDVALAETREHRLSMNLVQGDAMSLPFRRNVVDVGIYVAALHHLPTRELRLESLDEYARVLSPEGYGLISAWSTEHDRFRSPPSDDSNTTGTDQSDSSFHTRRSTTDRDQDQPLSADSEEFDGFDTVVDWTLPDGETVDRYYHIYSPAEFDADLAASQLAVCTVWVSSGNCYAIVQSSGDSS